MKFSSPQINLYVNDLSVSRAFYEQLGFKLVFTAEMEGEAVHQEFVLDGFKLGLASRTSADQVHGLIPGANAGSELVLWTADTDSAIYYVLEHGGTLLREPHDFLNGLRAGWVHDPDGNPVQLVCRNQPAGKPGKSGKPQKLSGTAQVLQFMEQLEHPLKPELEEVRRLILNSGEGITEHIKWKAPSFCCNNEDRITFNLQGKSGFRLIFHTGAKVQETAAGNPLFEDTTGLLEWKTGDRAIISIKDSADMEVKKEMLALTVSRWFKETAQ